MFEDGTRIIPELAMYQCDDDGYDEPQLPCSSAVE